MKTFFSICILLVVNYSAQDTLPNLEELDDIAENCIKTTNVDPSLPAKAFAEGKFVEDDKLKCFLKCMFVKMGDMSESGEVVLDSLEAYTPPGISPENASKIIATCKKSKGTDDCDTAFKLAQCMVDESIKAFAPKS